MPVADKAVAAFEYRAGINRTAERLHRALDPAGVSERDDRPQHCLTGDARKVVTFTADQFPFDRRDAEPGRAGPVSYGLADRAGADDDDVVESGRGIIHAAASRFWLVSFWYESRLAGGCLMP